MVQIQEQWVLRQLFLRLELTAREAFHDNAKRNFQKLFVALPLRLLALLEKQCNWLLTELIIVLWILPEELSLLLNTISVDLRKLQHLLVLFEPISKKLHSCEVDNREQRSVSLWELRRL